MSLARDLRRLGLRPGDTLMVHASMRRVGGRAEALLDALEEVLGPEGTLLMLICAPEGVFDPARSPAWDALGVLSEALRRRPGVVLNAHPYARMGALGRRAEALVLDPPLDDHYGPGSPLERLVEAGGRVLRLGADPDTLTLIHLAEYRARLPHKRRSRWTVQVQGPAGVEAVQGEALDDNAGIADGPPGVDVFSACLGDALACGLARRGRVGGADAELLDAAETLAFATAWLERHLVRHEPPGP